MKIGIIGADFAPGATGGTETYFRTLIGALQSFDRNNAYTVFVPEEFIPELQLHAPNFRAASIRARPPLLQRAIHKVRRAPRPGGRTPDPTVVAAINDQRFDVVHFPMQVISHWGLAASKVLTFNDMQHEFLPAFFSAAQLESRRSSYRPSAEAADQIIAISNFTRQTLIERYAIPGDRISAIHVAYDQSLFDRPRQARPRSLPEKYFFYPAATWPHKNHERLLAACATVRRSHPEYKLVLTGISMQQTDAIRNSIEKLGLADSVVMLGFVPYPRLPELYQHAFALVFPSLFEGFGIPLCEAMACGCPILASNGTSIPEVAGDAAHYFDPLDAADIAVKMLRLINQPDEREKLSTAGRARVNRFSLEAMGRDTVAAYERAVQVHD